MNENILLVEDEQALQMVLGDRLRKDGYSVDCASDGETGFRKAMSQPFDLMILDVMLPHRSGLEVCRDIRRTGLRMPVLMLTARGSTEDTVAGFRAGADAYVTKPFEMPELSARVEALLRRARAGWSRAQENVSLPTMSTRRSDVLKVGAAASQVLNQPANAVPERKFIDELGNRVAASKVCAQFVETVPRLRMMLDEEMESPHKPHHEPYLSAAEGIIQFLEEILSGVRSQRRHDSRKA